RRCPEACQARTRAWRPSRARAFGSWMGSLGSRGMVAFDRTQLAAKERAGLADDGVVLDRVAGLFLTLAALPECALGRALAHVLADDRAETRWRAQGLAEELVDLLLEIARLELLGFE